MKNKLTWISWVAIYLFIVSLVFLIYSQNTNISIVKGYDDYIFSLITLAPLVLFSVIVSVLIFKRIKTDPKKYWYIDNICNGTNVVSFIFFIISAVLLIILINNPEKKELMTWIKITMFDTIFLPLFITCSVMFRKILLNTKRKIRIRFWDISLGLFFGALFSQVYHLDSISVQLFFIFFVNGLAVALTLIFNLFLNNKALEIPFKILVCGFIAGSILLLINHLCNVNAPYSIYALTFICTVIVATDINLSLNPKENSVNPENKWRQDEI